jgi:quercetin dioxygenase-like cupin family protein
MTIDTGAGRGAVRLRPGELETLDVLGARIEFLQPQPASDGVPLALRGTLPPGAVVPLHSHPEPETFLLLEGAVQAFGEDEAGRVRRTTVRPGEVFHVPGDVRHGWRNAGPAPAVQLVVTTARLGRFFRDVAAAPGPDQFRDIARRYGHWLATPEESTEAGLPL